ncbi:ras-related protein Rab-32 isoform X7 [Leptopilina heterotoma]|uniref:ras-related protein Rab-32 isoform X7 n=1 Tax=Leptopilina heterotoma TaxID=63436 RepID=UPI001CA844EB|nr:ras-related protein Rab-32 isoform X7 [Leptopilina heterotoma]
MPDRNVVWVLRTRKDRNERRLRSRRESTFTPLIKEPQLLNINYLFLDHNMNFRDCDKEDNNKCRRKSSQNNVPNSGLGEKREHLYKILVIGELGAGKTSIIKRYVHQFFSQHYRATIGVDFALKVLNWDPHTIIRLQLWDIAGQERFGNMTRVYYKEAVGAFIVFDVTRSATLEAVVKWKQDLDSKVQLPDGSPIPCVLLANKCDQQKEGLVNTPTKMDEYCKEKNFAGWFETSAKENINIEEAARFLVNKILQNDQILKGSGSQDQTDGERFALNQSPTSSKKSCAC